MSKTKRNKASPAVCVYPGCSNTRRTRGLCHPHYQGFRAKVRAGTCTEADAEDRGLLMPAGTGGSTCVGHDAFTNPDARGDAPAYRAKMLRRRDRTRGS